MHSINMHMLLDPSDMAWCARVRESACALWFDRLSSAVRSPSFQCRHQARRNVRSGATAAKRWPRWSRIAMELESSRSTSMARRFGTSMVCSLLCSLIRSYKIRESAALIAEAVLR